MSKNKLFLVLTVLASLFVGTYLVFTHPNQSPPGFTTYEAQIGASAINRDFFKSHSPAYSLISSLLINQHNNTIIQLRILSKISFIILPLALGLLVWRFWRNVTLAGITVSISYLSPWLIELSRTAYPQVLSLSLTIIGLTFFTTSNYKYNSIGSLFFFLSFISHPTSAILNTILFIGALLFLNLSKSIFYLSIIIIFFLGYQYSHELKTFFLDNAFFNEIGFVNRINEFRGYLVDTPFQVLSPFVFNKLSWGVLQIFSRLIIPWDWYWLFSHSKFEPTIFNDTFGKFYYWELIAFAIGISSMVNLILRSLNGSKISKSSHETFVIYALIFASLPGAFKLKPELNLTFFYVIPFFYIVCAYGYYKVYSILINNRRLVRFKINYAIPLLTIFIYLLGAHIYRFYLINTFPVQKRQSWERGYSQLAYKLKILPHYNSYFITDRLGGDPAIQLSYHDPNFSKDKNISFGSIPPDQIHSGTDNLYFIVPSEMPKNILTCPLNIYNHCPKIIAINSIDGSIAGYLIIPYETNKI